MTFRGLAITGIALLALGSACGSESGEEAGPRSVHAGGSPGDGAIADSDPEALSDAVSDAVSEGTDAGIADATEADVGIPPDASACTLAETLLDLSGHSFTPSTSAPSESHAFGDKGVAYCSLRIQLDVHSADLQAVNTDAGMTRLEHIFFGLSRANQASSANRYLMGTAAVRFTNKSPSFKMYGRVAFAPGWQSYTAWQVSYAWQSNANYHIDCSLDAAAQEQRCSLLLDGALQKQVVGAIPYIQVSDMASAFTIELGTAPGGPELTAPFGWTLSNLTITATR